LLAGLDPNSVRNNSNGGTKVGSIITTVHNKLVVALGTAVEGNDLVRSDLGMSEIKLKHIF